MAKEKKYPDAKTKAEHEKYLNTQLKGKAYEEANRIENKIEHYKEEDKDKAISAGSTAIANLKVKIESNLDSLDKANEQRKRDAQPKRDKVVEIAQRLLAGGTHQKHELVGIINNREGIDFSPEWIRKILQEEGILK